VDQGIKMAEVDLSHLDTLPQMHLQPDASRPVPNKKVGCETLKHQKSQENLKI
jgi:hypothetical protein